MLANAAKRAFATAAPRILITGACGQIGTEYVQRRYLCGILTGSPPQEVRSGERYCF